MVRLAVITAALLACACGRYRFDPIGGGGDGGGDGGVVQACARLGLPSVPLIPRGRYAIVSGDFDRDGDADIVVGDDLSFQVMLGNGDGTFVPGASVATAAVFLATGDLDGDGSLDLVISGGGTATAWLGNGDGTFRMNATLVTSGGPAGAVIEDFNGDSRLDLAIAGQQSGPQFSVTVLLGTGTGSFQPGVDYLVGTSTMPSDVAAGDLDGNGTLDLVTGNLGNMSVSVLLGTGTGAFGAAQQFALSVTPKALVIMDVDGDGVRDVVSTGTGTTEVLHGNGNGTLAAPVASPGGGGGLRAIDLDGDSDLDLVVGDRLGSSFVVKLATGGGTFQMRSYPGEVNPSDLTSADFNGDGIVDLAITGDSTLIALGNGDGTLRGPTRLSGPPSMKAIVPGDLDRDGLVDLVTGGASLESQTGVAAVGILHATAPGVFAPSAPLSVPGRATSLALADFDGNGVLDLVVTDPGATSVFPGQGNGTFGTRMDLPGATIGAVADTDRDGHPDLVVVTSQVNEIRVARGNGDGTFQPAITTPTSFAPVGLAVGDLDHDGIVDIVTGSTQPVAIVLRGNGDGTFAEWSTIPLSAPLKVLALADLDRDGALDVVVLAGTLITLLGNGDATLRAVYEHSISATLFPQIGVGDVDGDRLPDVVVASGAEFVEVWLGTGDGRLRDAVYYPSGYFADAVYVGDLDGDGRADVVAHENAGRATLLLSRCLP